MSRPSHRDPPSESETSRDAPRAADELRRAVRRGTRAALLAQVASQVTSLVVLGILCRLVAPEDFGLFNTALLIVTLPRMLATLGLTAATIQRPDLGDAELAGLFRLQMMLGVGSAAIAAVAGPALGWVVGAPGIGHLCLVLSGTSLCAAFGAQHQALLERRLRVRRVVTVRLLAQVTAGVIAVAAALHGAGVGALVLQQYVELLVLAGLAWWSEPWRPTRQTAPVALRPLLVLGGNVSMTNLLFYLAQNTDKLLLFLVVGRTSAGQAVLGMYNLAFNLMMKPVYVVTTPVTGVMLPALSRAAPRRGEYAALAVGFYRLVAATLLPCGVGLWLVADDVTRILAGPRWGDAGLLLTILAPVILVQGFINIVGSLLTSAGRTRALMWGASIVALVQMQGHVAGCLFGRALWGAAEPSPGLAAARGIASAYSFVLVVVIAVPYLLFAFRQAGVTAKQVVRAIRPSLIASVSMGLVVWGVRRALDAHGPWTPLPRLALCVAAGVLTYGVLARREIWAALRFTPGWSASSDNLADRG